MAVAPRATTSASSIFTSSRTSKSTVSPVLASAEERLRVRRNLTGVPSCRTNGPGVCAKQSAEITNADVSTLVIGIAGGFLLRMIGRKEGLEYVVPEPTAYCASPARRAWPFRWLAWARAGGHVWAGPSSGHDSSLRQNARQ